MITIPRGLIAAFSLLILALTCGGLWFWMEQQQLVKDQVESSLQAITQLKANQIADWRAGKLKEAAVIMESPFFSQAVQQWIANPDEGLTERFLIRFRSMRDHFHYKDIVLVDRDGQIRISLNDFHGSIPPLAAQGMAEAFRERRPVITDLHTGPSGMSSLIDVIAPFFSGTANRGDPVGAVILVIDARQFLDTFIEVWPVPSRTAETLLVRRIGGSILFLNELRHSTNAEMTLPMPLNIRDTSPVMTVPGRAGVVQGTDYRGVQVLSITKAIPRSPWFIIAKIDVEEALAAWKWTSFFIIALGVATTASLLALAGMIWQRISKAQYRALYESEASLRRMQERYKTTLTSIGDGVLSVDASARVEFLNPVAEALTGWKQEEAIGRSLEDVFRMVDEQTRRPIENPVTRAISDGVVVGPANHALLISKDDAELPIADSAAPIRDENGSISGAVLVFRDLTSERAQQRNLDAEKERAKEYLDVAGVMMLALDIDGTVLMVNRKGCEVLGFAEAEILGKNWLDDFVPETARAKAKIFFTETINCKPGAEQYTEIPIITLSGNERIIAWHNSILKSPEGAIIGTLSSAEDITERKRMEEDLKSSRDLMNLVMNSLPVAVFYVNAEGRFQFNNSTHKKWCGLGSEDVSGKDYHQVLGSQRYEGIIRNRVEAALRGEEVAYETTVSYRDGFTRDIAVDYMPHFGDDHKLLGFIGLVQDITSRKEQEKRQVELIEEIRHFAYIVSHDLRAPLTNLKGFSRELEVTTSDLGVALASNINCIPIELQSEINTAIREEIPECIGFINSSVRRMDHLISAILHLSRLGHCELCFQPINMNSLVDEVIRSQAYQISVKKARLSVECLPDIVADRTAMEQILGNLVDNAVKYLDPFRAGEITISGWTRGHNSVFQIQDNGSGIADSDLERIFQVFQRAGNGSVPGEGMGLAHVRALVRRHDGIIWCESELGVGSKFTFTVSNYQSAAQDEGQQHNP